MRALKEGGVGTWSFIFFSGKLLYFYLGLCDYSDKFPKMFYSSCGMECPSTSNFCHKCDQQLNLSQNICSSSQLLLKSMLKYKKNHSASPATYVTYEINDKIYFLKEPKKSASAVALLKNQLQNTIKELKISASTVTGVRSISKTRK